MNDNKNYKPVYKCGICGNKFTSVQDRLNCEMSCIAKQKEEEKKVAEAKKMAEKEASQNEVTAALDNALALLNKHIEKYGTYQYNGKLNELDAVNMDFFPSKLWHHFWF